MMKVQMIENDEDSKKWAAVGSEIGTVIRTFYHRYDALDFAEYCNRQELYAVKEAVTQ